MASPTAFVSTLAPLKRLPAHRHCYPSSSHSTLSSSPTASNRTWRCPPSRSSSLRSRHDHRSGTNPIQSSCYRTSSFIPTEANPLSSSSSSSSTSSTTIPFVSSNASASPPSSPPPLPLLQSPPSPSSTAPTPPLIASTTGSASSSASTTVSASSPTVLTVISTIVGVCVLIGSLLYKLPQVIRVVRRRSAAGISVLMYALETLGTTFSALYFARRSFPFSTYGETVFIMIQNVVLLALIVFYNDLPRVPAIVLATIYFSMVIALLSPFVPLSLLVALQFCSIPILNLARVPQIMLNYRRKATGELSPITLGLQLLGNVARIFTTVAQVRDPLMFIGICVATCFNTTLFAQWVYYSRRASKSTQPS